MKSRPSLISLITLLLFFSLSLVAAFTQASVPQPQAPQAKQLSYGDLEDYGQFLTYFYTKTFIKRDRTQVTIPFGYQGEPPLLFVGFAPQDDTQLQQYLISHPQITNLDWHKLEGEPYSLYQKIPTYTSVEDFINNPPSGEKIAIDPTVSRKLHPNFQQATYTEKELDLDQIDYILTNYHRPHKNGDVYTWTKVIDASGAEINRANQIEWYIKAPLTEEKGPYRLGEIQVDYLQH